MQRIERSQISGRFLSSAADDFGNHFDERESAEEIRRRFALCCRELQLVQTDPHLVFQQTTGDQWLVPEPWIRPLVFSEELREGDR